jgi:hypothetical protein
VVRRGGGGSRQGGGGVFGCWNASRARMQRVSCRVTVVLVPTVLPGSLMKATATGCHWKKKQGYGEVDLEDRNAMSWRGREEGDSSHGVHHQCCKRLEAMASSPWKGEARGHILLSLGSEFSGEWG